VQFAFSLLTRSLRVTHDNLRVRDPKFVETVDRWFAEQAMPSGGVTATPPPPPMFTPFRLRDLVLRNRVVVSPMTQDAASDGTPGDWHLVHLGSRAVGGAGLIIAEMTAVSRDGRVTPGCTGMYAPAHVAAWARAVEFVHRFTSSKIGLQLSHAGRRAAVGGEAVLSASPISYLPGGPVPREATRADMDVVRDDFVRAAAAAIHRH